jgi:hypothetical protein
MLRSTWPLKQLIFIGDAIIHNELEIMRAVVMIYFNTGSIKASPTNQLRSTLAVHVKIYDIFNIFQLGYHVTKFTKE